MISSSYVYDTIRTLIRKDQQGNAFNITEYNNIIKAVNYSLYNKYTADLEENAEITNKLRPFIRRNVNLTLTGGSAELPSIVERLIGKPHYIDGSDIRPVDIVTALEWADRQADELTKPTTTHPIMALGVYNDPDDVYVLPGTISAVRISFMVLPTTPFLDYYVLSTGAYVYLDEDATSITLPTGAVYRDGTVGPGTIATSLTVDFEWHEHETPIIINMILQKAGLIIKDEGAIQYGIAKETKEEQQ